MRASLLPLVLLAALAAGGTAPAQAPAPAPTNLVRNPGFESGFRLDDLWDGVDATGFLAGNRASLPVLTSGGGIQPSPMPVSVSAADLNGDGLVDIAVMDPIGYMLVYFNSGTKTEPKFTVGEMANNFLTRLPAPPDPLLADILSTQETSTDARLAARRGQRIFLADFSRSGRRDVLIGNYLGELLLLPNAGSGARPDFRQPNQIRQILIPSTKDPTMRWASLLAPVTFDINGDGRDDILVGEGSYSANSIHALINQAGGGRPALDENQRRIAAFGMGLEQLTPAVADYNGDGQPDLIVTERTGKVAVYLNNGSRGEKPFDFFKFIPAGKPSPMTAAVSANQTNDPMVAARAPGLISLGGIATVTTADLNGDGLFDLLFGKSNGRVAVTLNTGNAKEPAFAAPTELKGQTGTLPFQLPAGWEVDYGLEKGNFYGFISLVNETTEPGLAPPEGKSALKIGYRKSPNTIMPVPTFYSPGIGRWEPQNIKFPSPLTYRTSPANSFVMTQSINLKAGTTYTLTARVKGSRVGNANIVVGIGGRLVLESRVTRGDRGSVNRVEDAVMLNEAVSVPISASPNWSEIRREVNVNVSDPRAKRVLESGKIPPESRVSTFISITADVTPGEGVLYIDDLKLVPK